MVKEYYRSFFTAIILTSTVLSSVLVSSAETMSSSNFKILSDSINTGGLLSSSTNYALEDTAGDIATGESTSTNYSLRAGYQQMNEVYISLSNIDNVLLTPSLPGLSGGVVQGNVSFVVTTDSPGGYTARLAALNSPAMQSDSATIADYVTAGGVPDFVFTTDPTDAHFGYTIEGVDTALRFLDNGTVCGVSGTNTRARCWQGLSTTSVEIARGLSNHPAGSPTTIRFAVGIGGGVPVLEGNYTATATVTVLPL